MQNFAEQCLDLAKSVLSHNLGAINEDGTLQPVSGEVTRWDEPGHASLAIGEYHRLTQETQFENYDLIDLTARTITAQVFIEQEAENGLAYAALGLLSFGPAKERNAVWERLMDITRETLDKRLLHRSDYDDHFQAFNIAKAVTRFSLGLSKKDETGKLIDRLVERISETSSQGYVDDNPSGLGGCFDIYGILSFVFTRQALQLHGNIHLRDRKLPSLRTPATKYLKMLPDIVRVDGLGWSFGRSIGAYGQMHSISLILQALRDGWIEEKDRKKYNDCLRRLFQFFFTTYIDQEHGCVVVRDAERETGSNHTTRIANFDAARYLCQWARLARAIGGSLEGSAPVTKRSGRFILFDKSQRKEQGIFNYNDPDSGVHFQIPLVSPGPTHDSSSLAFPHMPGIFDWPSTSYLPILQPELTFGDKVVVPSYYGTKCTTGLGMRNSYFFRYEQPDLISTTAEKLPGLGSCKVNWNFQGGKFSCDYIFTVKNQVTLNRLRYMIAIGAPHSIYRSGMTMVIGEQGQRPSVLKDDFQAQWQDTVVVTEDPQYRSFWGNLHYLQVLERDHPLVMRPGVQYRLMIEFEPDITMADA